MVMIGDPTSKKDPPTVIFTRSSSPVMKMGIDVGKQ